MHYYFTAVSVIAGSCLGFGILYLFVGLRRKDNKPLNLTFALFALCYAATLVNGIRWYSATTVTEYIAANRYDSIFVVGAYVGLIWYVALYTGVIPRIFLSILTAIYVIVGMVRIISPPTYFGQIFGLTSINLPWGEKLATLDSAGSIWIDIFLLAQLVTLGFIIFALTRQFIRGERQPAVILGLGLLPFIAGILYEVLGESGVVPYIPFGEFGFLGIAIAASLQMANSVIKTEEALARHQDELTMLVEERTAHLQEANKRLVAQERISAATEERRRLAGELHDSVTQTLYSVGLVAAALPRLLERNIEETKRSALHLRNMTLGALAEMRTLLYELRPETLANSKLTTLLQQVADVFTGRTQIPVEITVQGDPQPPSEVKLAFYRIAQEALNNADKHAAATCLSVVLLDDGDNLALRIEDDGRGFDAETAAQEGQGLSIMRERAMKMDARLEIASEEGRGTIIAVRWPKDDYHA